MSVKEFGSVVLAVIFWPFVALWTMWETSSKNPLNDFALAGDVVWILMSALHLCVKVLFTPHVKLIILSWVLCHLILGIVWCLWMVFVLLTIPDDGTWCDTEFEIAS